MRGFVAWAALLVGCNGEDARGVLVEVHSDIEATRYELILSMEHCAECTHVYPPSYARDHSDGMILGTGWKSRDLESFTVVFDSPQTAAHFQLQAPETVTVKRALVVALAGDQPVQLETVLGAQAFGPFEIPGNDSVKFEIDLRPTDPLGTTTNMDHAELWRRSLELGDHTACAVVQHEDGENEFFVPADDTDCDDPTRSAPECDPFAYVATLPPPLERASCRAGDNEGHCYIGGMPCSESAAPGNPLPVCAPVAPHYCVPQYICGTTTCSGLDFFDYIPAGVPVAVCDVATTNGRPCDGVAQSTIFDLKNLVGDIDGTCKSIQIARAEPPITFGDSITFGDVNLTATFSIDQVTFNPSTCKIQVSWNGYLPVGATAIVKVVTSEGVNRVVAWRIKPALVCGSGATMTCGSNIGEATDTFYTCR